MHSTSTLKTRHKPKDTSTWVFAVVAVVILAVLVVGHIQPANAHSVQLLAYGQNDKGQLANGSLSGSFGKAKLPPISQLSAGFDHMVALDENGQVWVWGDNNYGQLGLGSSRGVFTTPQLLEGLPDITAVQAGFRHSLLLGRDGNVWAFGNNIAGQLGTGDRIDSNAPLLLNLPSKISSVTAGHRFSLATATDGSVYGWGASCETGTKRSFKELLRLIGDSAKGISYYVDASADPSDSTSQELCEFEGFVPVNSLLPVLLPDLHGSSKIVAGFGHLLAMQPDGTVKSAGCNAYGQLGRVQAEITPATVIEGLRGVEVVDIAVSTRHSLVLDSTGAVWGFGGNHVGQIGQANIADSLFPLKIQGLPPIKAIATGHDYSLALATDGTVWGFGSNADGQIPGVIESHNNSAPVVTSIYTSQLWAGGSATLLRTALE